jgi:acetylcholinesterase
MFFMTGGGFIIGGINLPWQIPTSWVERSQSAIIVTINYRINIFGFPNAAGLPKGEQNLGVMDQRLALEWVRDNIAAFGGDPTRIMQWGRSAGAVSTDIHAYAYPEDPIAESYYAESGAVSTFRTAQDPIHSNFTFVAQNVGCGEPCGPSGCPDEETHALAEVDCMRSVSMIQISNFIGQYQDRGEQPPITFNLIVDDKIYFEDYEALAAEGRLAHVPAIFSYTSNEFSALVPWPASNLTEGPWYPPIAAGNMNFAVCGGRNATFARNNIGVPVYRFQYAAEFPNLNVYEWLGAYHNAETPLVFGTYHLLDHIAPSTEFQEQMSLSIQEHILAFAMDPYNGPQKLGWQPTDLEAPNGGFILRFGGKSGNLTSVVDGIEIDGACLGLSEYDPFP